MSETKNEGFDPQTVLAAARAIVEDHGSFKEAVGLGDQEIRALGMYARQLAEAGQIEDASRMFEGLVELAGDNGYFHCCLGALYLKLGRGGEAKEKFHHALAVDAFDIAANTYLGEILLQEGDVEQGVSYLRQAAEADPDGRDPHACRARALVSVADAAAGAR